MIAGSKDKKEKKFAAYKPKGEPKLIFNEEFDTFNQDLWTHVNSQDGFHFYGNNRTNTFVENGTFYL